ncbi:MAG: hypothetical protein R2821_07965 [Flavobacteriaceae bacterium]|jgi:chaperonin GroEL (HSP60 family)
MNGIISEIIAINPIVINQIIDIFCSLIITIFESKKERIKKAKNAKKNNVKGKLTAVSSSTKKIAVELKAMKSIKASKKRKDFFIKTINVIKNKNTMPYQFIVILITPTFILAQ